MAINTITVNKCLQKTKQKCQTHGGARGITNVSKTLHLGCSDISVWIRVKGQQINTAIPRLIMDQFIHY